MSFPTSNHNNRTKTMRTRTRQKRLELYMTHRISVLGLALYCVSGVALAQPQDQRPVSSVSPSSRVVSLGALLQLQNEQEVRLNRLYDEYAQRRAEQESRFASRQNGRTSSFDERLRRDQLQAQQKIADALLSKRKQALEVLGPIQRSQLQSYARDPRFELQRDRYYQLLLLPVEDLGVAPLDLQGRSPRAGTYNRPGRSQGLGSYGVYGGYSYGGPSYGVYGNVGSGSVGVHAGIGNRGPSIGIGIGRVFGGVRF